MYMYTHSSISQETIIAADTPKGEKKKVPCTYHFLSSLLSIHEAFGNDSRDEDLVALPELLEEHAVGEAKAADPDALQHSVATQLVQHQMSHDLARLRGGEGAGLEQQQH